MQTYKVIWEIDIDAESPKEAARLAQECQNRPDEYPYAQCFEVYDETGAREHIDLLED